MDVVSLYRDGRFVAVDKPAGVLVVPGRGAEADEPTLARAVEAALSLPRLWVVHRLDRETSGVVLFALDASAHRLASAAFADRRAVKRYLAIVRGTPDPAAGRIDAALGPDPRRRGRGGTVATKGGRPSVTEYRVVRRLPALEAALVEACPLTGRTHQIRVHLASIGHPVLQDARYGQLDPRLPLGRLALHAASLSIPSLALEVSAPLPADLAALANARG